jgi:hypothetical protein
MPIYINPALKKKLAPSLLKLLKSKTCFHIKTLSPELHATIQSAVELGTNSYRHKGRL